MDVRCLINGPYYPSDMVERVKGSATKTVVSKGTFTAKVHSFGPISWMGRKEYEREHTIHTRTLHYAPSELPDEIKIYPVGDLAIVGKKDKIIAALTNELQTRPKLVFDTRRTPKIAVGQTKGIFIFAISSYDVSERGTRWHGGGTSSSPVGHSKLTGGVQWKDKRNFLWVNLLPGKLGVPGGGGMGGGYSLHPGDLSNAFLWYLNTPESKAEMKG